MEFDPKEVKEYRIIEVPLEATSSVRIVAPIDFSLEEECSNLFPDFDLESEAIKRAEVLMPGISWEIHPVLELEFVDNLILEKD